MPKSRSGCWFSIELLKKKMSVTIFFSLLNFKINYQVHEKFSDSIKILYSPRRWFFSV